MNWIGFTVLTVVLCAYPTEQAFRIVNGKTDDITHVPYQVAILTSGLDRFCGGSILSATIVLTAAHCFNDQAPNAEFYIRAGSNYTDYGGQLSYVRKWVQHPDFVQESFENDFALIYLQKKLEMNDAVRPAKLVSNANEIVAGLKVLISGYGLTFEHEKPLKNKRLRSAQIQLSKPEDCVDFYKSYMALNKNAILCADVLKNGRDSCKADSGSPVTYKGHVIGLVSFGAGCGQVGVPGVYAKVSNNLEWIVKEMKAEY